LSSRFEGEYCCGWCQHKFTATFGVYTVKGRGRQNGTSAVKCPNCNHNLKPKDDAIRVREIKEKEGVLQ